MKIHAIQTGTVAITKSWREGDGDGQGRLLRTLLDREWTEPLPIFAFAIEHPEGVIVVDTGETARVSEPGYFPRWHPLLRFAVREWVEPEQEIGPQLAQLGIDAERRPLVVMTHLHTDHAGGLHHFPRHRDPRHAAPTSSTRAAFAAACAATRATAGRAGSTRRRSTCNRPRSARFRKACS